MPVPRRLGIRIKEIAGGSKDTILKKGEDELKKKKKVLSKVWSLH